MGRFRQRNAAVGRRWASAQRSLLAGPLGPAVLLGLFVIFAAPSVAMDWFVRDPEIVQIGGVAPHWFALVPFATWYLAGFALSLLFLTTDAVLCRAWRRWARWQPGYRDMVFWLPTMGLWIFAWLPLWLGVQSSLAVGVAVAWLAALPGLVPGLVLTLMLQHPRTGE